MIINQTGGETAPDITSGVYYIGVSDIVTDYMQTLGKDEIIGPETVAEVMTGTKVADIDGEEFYRFPTVNIVKGASNDRTNPKFKLRNTHNGYRLPSWKNNILHTSGFIAAAYYEGGNGGDIMKGWRLLPATGRPRGGLYGATRIDATLDIDRNVEGKYDVDLTKMDIAGNGNVLPSSTVGGYMIPKWDGLSARLMLLYIITSFN